VNRFIAKPKKAVIFISSDINEILEIADRILVISDRSVVANLGARDTNKHEIVQYSMRLVNQAS
jgi:ABC-type sugar transport system ATPase subunit